MIEAGCILKFGYGDIAVGPMWGLVGVTFQGFKPATDCGTKITYDVEYVTERYNLILCNKGNLAVYKAFSELLHAVLDGKIQTFRFDEYLFDFTNFNPESVRAILDNMKKSFEMNCLSFAA